MLDSMFFVQFFMNRTVRPQSLQFVCCLKCSLVVGVVRNFFYQLRITHFAVFVYHDDSSCRQSP